MLISYTTNAFPEDYTPTVFDNYSTNLMVNSQPVNLCLFDTAGQDDYDRQRPLSYHQTDIFLVCYSLVDADSLNAVRDKWMPELQTHCPGVPVMLIGTKQDLAEERERNKKPPVIDTAVRNNLITSLGFVQHLECSALTQKGLSEIFDAACKVVLKPQQKGKGPASGCCAIL